MIARNFNEIVDKNEKWRGKNKRKPVIILISWRFGDYFTLLGYVSPTYTWSTPIHGSTTGKVWHILRKGFMNLLTT